MTRLGCDQQPSTSHWRNTACACRGSSPLSTGLPVVSLWHPVSAEAEGHQAPEGSGEARAGAAGCPGCHANRRHRQHAQLCRACPRCFCWRLQDRLPCEAALCRLVPACACSVGCRRMLECCMQWLLVAVCADDLACPACAHLTTLAGTDKGPNRPADMGPWLMFSQFRASSALQTQGT